MKQTSFNLDQIPDTRPLPNTIAINNLDGPPPKTELQQFAAAIGNMPPNIAKAICRAIGGIESIDNIEDIARLSGVSVSTIYRHLRKANQALKSPPGIGSLDKETKDSGVRRGAEHGVTNAGRAGKKEERAEKETEKKPGSKTEKPTEKKQENKTESKSGKRYIRNEKTKKRN